ncbi:Oidioi.mRNA.OKI2018_I69.chr2.g7370.t1.cds [Oikopleura dioica]|uniref:Oidioi.mRNA.OKI2018_I69.chr2.g7370.t1.cds n=1 Tax=Oikopleura dioica TaxID=34765 RepID=A0ABN7TEZ4_OIKDI|nr:Oidioi.mRNA.OKI2018_I69.chr2.g7370.t1.cds [Oikopleura dioica]
MNPPEEPKRWMKNLGGKRNKDQQRGGKISENSYEIQNPAKREQEAVSPWQGPTTVYPSSVGFQPPHCYPPPINNHEANMAYFQSIASHQPLSYLNPYSLPSIPPFPAISTESQPLPPATITINQNDPGKSKGKFINLLDTVLKLKRTLSDPNPNQSSLAEAEKLRKTLKNSSCILSVTTRVNDNRVQLEKWDSMGRPKKVYLFFELYNLLHKYDKHRQTVKRIRPNNIYRANCKSDELTTKMNLLCLNPFHWECLMDRNEFTERMVKIVWTEDKGVHMKSICGLWAADIHKFVDWNENCSPEKFLDLVKMRVGCSETKDITQMMNMYCKKLKFLGVRKLDCIYYNEKTSIEKIREIERRLVKFCRPEVYEKFAVGNDIFNTDVETKFRWTCDDVKTSRICCNPDHVDSVHPNKDPFRLNNVFGYNAASSKLKKIIESKSANAPLSNSDGHKIWCYLYFNRYGTRSRKTVHDQFVGWFLTDKVKDVKYDSEINIEPLMTQTHMGKNLNEGELQNPSSFNLQNKTIDDKKRCQRLGHKCSKAICDLSFARPKNFQKASGVRLSVTLKREPTLIGFDQSDSADCHDSIITIHNNGTEKIWYHSMLTEIQKLGKTAEKESKVVTYNDLEAIDPSVYRVIHPGESVPVFKLNLEFRRLTSSLTSKQLRNVRERFFTVYVVPEWDSKTETMFSDIGNGVAKFTHADGLGGIEHLAFISVIHLDYLSHAEKRKTQSSLCPDSDT